MRALDFKYKKKKSQEKNHAKDYLYDNVFEYTFVTLSNHLATPWGVPTPKLRMLYRGTNTE